MKREHEWGTPCLAICNNGEQVIEHAKPRVLLIDDEQEFLRTLSDRLKIRGLRVTTALSGAEALEKIAHQEFDVIIIDLSMPVMDGLETTRRIKKLSSASEVIILTGHGSIKSGVNAMKHGAYDFVEKPVEINRLLGKIRAAGKRHEQSMHDQTRAELKQITNSHSW